MTAGKLEFGTLNLTMITTETENVDIHSTLYYLYDGRIVVAGVTQTGKRPSFSGIGKGESFVTEVIAEVGVRHNLTVNSKYLGFGQIIDFDYHYKMYDGIQNWYDYTIDFGIENLS